MADITKCMNMSCPLRGTCYRAQAEPGFRQSMSHFQYSVKNGVAECEHYWETKPYQNLPIDPANNF